MNSLRGRKPGVWQRLVEQVDRLKTIFQLGGFIILTLSLAVVLLSDQLQVIPLALVVCTVPPILVTARIDGLTRAHQFVVLLVCSAMTVGFLSVAMAMVITAAEVGRATARAPWDMRLLDDYRSVQMEHQALDRETFALIEHQISSGMQYPQYRVAMLSVFPVHDRAKADRLERLVEFYEHGISCGSAGQCSDTLATQQMRREIENLWYAYRPVIEELRYARLGQSFASLLQQRAEQWRRPLYASAIIYDEARGTTRLKSDAPQR